MPDAARHSRLLLLPAAILVVAAWLIPFLAHLFSVDILTRVPLWVVLTMLLVAAVMLFAVRGYARWRFTLALLMLVTTAALIPLRSATRPAVDLERTWRAESSDEIARTLHAVGREIADLEQLSGTIGRELGAKLRTSVAPDGGLDRFAAFALLDSLVAGLPESRALPPGTQIGVQVFDASGERVAWGGWPQSTSRLDARFIQSGAELIYPRTVSLYSILTHLVPVEDGARRIATVMVDIPLEVNFRVNNRFLKSSSLADNIAFGSVASVSFDYFPVIEMLPDRLERYRREQEATLEARRRLLAAGRERFERARAGAGGEDEEDGGGAGGRAARRGRLATEDSVLTFYPFPAFIEPVTEIAGDKATGLTGRAVIHAPQGNPILRVSATGHPFRHFVAERDAHNLLLARLLLLAGLGILFAGAMGATAGPAERAAAQPRGASWPRRLGRAVMLVGFLAVLRYALLPLYTTSPSAGTKILDPTVFATPLFGGIMRSAGDLMLTAFVFVVALYGVFRVLRGRGEAALPPAPPRRVGAAWVVLLGVLTAAALVGVFELSSGFTSTVVVNSNPRLLGETMEVADLEVNALHSSIFLMLTGIMLAGILLVWGVSRLTGGRGLLRSAPVALAVIALVALAAHGWTLAVVSAMLLAFIVLAPKFVQRENLVSIVMASFFLVLVSSAVAYTFISRDYDQLRKTFVLEKSDELLNPADDWKVVILEDVLGDYSSRPDVRQAVRNPTTEGVQRLAFDLWADSPLSLLGYSCAIHVITAADSVISDFAVDMPYRARITEGGERIDAPGENEWVVLDLTRNTPQGIVRFYRGILNLYDLRAEDGGRMIRHLVGRVVVDLPFFFESLEWAARTGPRTPELLRNVQEGGVAPRVEEPEALLLARIDGRQVHESSSERVPLGMEIPEDVFQRALDGRWPLLKAGGRTFRFVVRDTEVPGEYLLAGFAVPTPLRHVLRWSTVFSLYLLYTVAVIVAIIILGTIPYLKEFVPTLTPGRKLGFQQKLLASFLVVALVPAIILGLFSVNFIKDRFVEENRKEALYKAFSARKAFVNLLHGELQFFLNETDGVASLFDAGGGPQRVGYKRRVVLLRDTEDIARGGDEGADTVAVAVRGIADEISPDDLFLNRDGGDRYVGVVSAPVHVSPPEHARRSEDHPGGTYYVYYARLVDSDLLGEIAGQVSADVNVYDDGELVASSREGLLAGGFISSIMNADAFLEVSVLGSDHSLATERAGRYSYQVAYLPVAGWANRAISTAGGDGPGTGFLSGDDNGAGSGSVSGGGDGSGADSISGGGNTDRAAMSVPLLFRPESYYAEVQRATSIVLGIFALLFAATIGLGLVLARGIFEPLRALLAGTRRIGEGDLSVKIGVRRRDEIGTVVDAFNEMTERVAASQRALEERRRYLETILENIGTGVISTDADGRVRTVNAAAERILGMSEAEAVGATAGELAAAGKASEIFGLLEGASRSSAPFVADEVELIGEGRKSTVKYMLNRLDVDGSYFGAVFVFEDLTELIQSKKLSAWVEMARQIAHEIKNPLTPIRISTQFMQRAYDQKPEQFERAFREGTETILHQVDVLKRIAGEFSSYGRMQQLDIGAHRLDPLVRSIVTPYQNNAAGVDIAYRNGIPEATVLVDPEAVRKICANLIENALDAMPQGGDLEVSFDEYDEYGQRYIRVSFRDTGPGLSDEAAEKLFEPYFSTKTTGTGLGLAICRQLSHEMGGDVTVHNVEDGHGVEAAITLRAAS